MKREKTLLPARAQLRTGRKILEGRARKAGLTQLQVTNALGYSSPQAISNFEAGIEVPTLRKIAAFEKLYKVDVRKLLNLVLEIERGFVTLAPKDERRLGR